PFERLFMPRGTFRLSQFGGSVRPDKLAAAVQELAEKVYAAREEAFGVAPNGAPLMRELERVIMLRVVDEYWMDHIDAMDELKRGIGLRGYGSVKPIDAYKQEGFDMFEAMVHGIREETVRRLYTVRIRREAPIERKAVAKNAAANVGGEPVKKQPVKKLPKPGRNDPCPCGKMKADGSRRLKYKECCGRNEK
ncbi:MAG: preprotein translocase subunit SecA, partial [Oscillospiraceae bacterium]|nr:preprotein translocase subunit SecA [Oscillospiraceae bacterium]